MKFYKPVILFVGAALFAGAVCSADAVPTEKKVDSVQSEKTADAGKPKRVRRDIPWVSLAHQRALRAQAEGIQTKPEETKKGGYLSTLTKDSAPELTADKFKYADDNSGKLVATGDVRIYDKNYEAFSDKVEFSQNEGYARTSGNVRLSDTRYRAGAGTILELNSAQLAQTQAQLNYSQAIYDYLSAKAEYDRLIGREE